MIIALTGPSKCGKDTAAQYLQDAWATSSHAFAAYRLSTQFALADPLRDAADALGVSRRASRDCKDESLNGSMTGRHLLLALGSAARGVLGQDYFARLGAERAKDAESLCEGRLVVVTDVRREIEARTLLAAGARLLFVDRGIDPNTDALFGPEWPAIRALGPATLSNRGGLAELAVACRAVVDALRFEKQLSEGKS